MPVRDRHDVPSDGLGHLVWSFVRKIVCRSLQHLGAGAGNALAEKPRDCRWTDGILVAVQHESRGTDRNLAPDTFREDGASKSCDGFPK